MILLVLLLVGGGILVCVDYRDSTVKIENGIFRNTYGRGRRTEKLKVEVDGREMADLEIEVSERTYTSNEMKKLFKKSIKQLDSLILGENEELGHIEENMNLITEIPEEPIDVTWELDRYDVMNVYGELVTKNLTEKGTPVKLKAVLTYREDESMQALYECMAVIYPKTLVGKEAFVERVKQELKKRDEESRVKEALLLPESIGGKKLDFYHAMNMRGIVIIVMVVLIFPLMYALEEQNQGKKSEEKKKQMILDYPEIVSKLTLLLGAGMTVKRAWRKIVTDYEKGRARSGERYAYEEMAYTSREMEGGVAEAECYERFGKRCNVQEYLRLGALLSQNLRKGTKGLNDLLRFEAVQSFEERKAKAKRLGEEAGTKLLMPMFLMLTEVLIIVVVSAFFSVRL